MMSVVTTPRIVFLFFGKRKSGKDYVVDKLHKLIGYDKSCIIRISAPLKEQYAKDHDLDYSRLLDSSTYKEEHRLSMIKWSEDIRSKDPAYFCSLAIKNADKSVWLISDCRRLTDMQYFTSNYKCIAIRVQANDDVRKRRGWIYTPEIDDAPSECGLDMYPYDYHVTNNGDEVVLMTDLEKLINKAL